MDKVYVRLDDYVGREHMIQHVDGMEVLKIEICSDELHAEVRFLRNTRYFMSDGRDFIIDKQSFILKPEYVQKPTEPIAPYTARQVQDAVVSIVALAKEKLPRLPFNCMGYDITSYEGVGMKFEESYFTQDEMVRITKVLVQIYGDLLEEEE